MEDGLDVIVVGSGHCGAGISGLSCAQALKAAGSRVLVLEARNRIGGRVHTASVGPVHAVDLGGQFLHGSARNPLTKLIVRDLKLATQAMDYDSFMVFDCRSGEKTDGSPSILAKDVMQQAEQEWERILKEIAKLQDNVDKDCALQSAIATAVKTLRVAGKVPLLATAPSLLRMMTQLTYDLEYAFSPTEASLWWHDCDDELHGPDLVLLGGYAGLLAHLSAGVDIRLRGSTPW